ncbi:MAG TPA: SPOR domain-containing protein [Flavobacteriaceae bacterium]|nr:SPOR domain-containing protein [Flavobacteriaceae bacterium]
MFKSLNIIIILLLVNMHFSYAQDGVIQIDSSQDIKNLVTKKITYNTTNNTQKSYKIQLFYGSEGGAIRTLNKFRELFPNTSSNLIFDSPNWKVKVGNYKTRLKADKHLQEVILVFGDAIVLEPKKKS